MVRVPAGDRLSRRQQFALVAIAGLVVGATLAPVAVGILDDSGTVAVVEISGILTSDSVAPIAADLAAIRDDPSIGAVVLRIDSPGGTVAGSERLYLAVQRTATQVPVVASVQETGASGAYYGLLPSDEVYVLPSSIVGSVGVVGPQPQPMFPDESKSGANKQATDPDHIRRVVETMKRSFVASVLKHRGSAIELDRSQIASGEVYPGIQAVENGFADTIGTTEDAIAAAAERAGLDSVTLETYRHAGGRSTILLQEGAANETTVVLEEPVGYRGVDTPMYFMVYGEIRTDPVVVSSPSTDTAEVGS